MVEFVLSETYFVPRPAFLHNHKYNDNQKKERDVRLFGNMPVYANKAHQGGRHPFNIITEEILK